MLTIQLLGQFEIALDGQRVDLPTRAAESLAAWLVLHPGPAHRREMLAGILWPESDESNAHSQLRHALWRLRRAIPDDYLLTNHRTIGWKADAPYTLDVDALCSDSDTIEGSAAAANSYQGELLPGFYDDWVVRERERLAGVYETHMTRLLKLLVAAGHWQEAIDWAEKWIAQGQTPEPAYRTLMCAHANKGNSTAALAAYQRCTDALKRELDVPPSPETTALADAIRNSSFTIHNLRFPSPQSPNLQSPITGSPPSNLPAATTPLVGREIEVAQLTALLTSPDHRLVTITGPGGIGKSRLALAAGHAVLSAFPDGVFLVRLVALTSADEIPRAVADALGYLFQSDGRSQHQQVTDLLQSRQLLLLLDNFEHVLGGAEFVVALLEAAPDLHLLITSRERLRLSAETIFSLEGLTYPAKDAPTNGAETYTALELFAQSAGRVLRDFAPVAADWSAIASICRLVGGAPLGVILAASWVEHLSPADISGEIAANIDLLGQELQDLEPRHRSFEAVFAQSWQRLSPSEQQALMGMSICAGGFDRAAAQAIAGAGLPVLSRLVDKSLLSRVDEGRYDLHELIRQMARRKVQEAGQEEEALRLHSRYFLRFVVEQKARLKGGQQEAAVESLAGEHENVRAAWGWAAQTGEIELLSGALEGLGIALNRPGQWEEGAALMARALDALPAPSTTETRLLRAGLLVWHAIFLSETMQLEPSQVRFDQATALLDDPILAAAEKRPLLGLIALYSSGPAILYRRPEQVIADRQRAARFFEELGDMWWLVRAQTAVGGLEYSMDLYSQAEERYSSLRQIAQQTGDVIALSEILNHLSLLLEYAGRFSEAEAAVEEWRRLPIRRPHRFSHWDRTAWVAFCAGRFQDALDGLLDPFPGELNSVLPPERNQMGINGLARAHNHLGNFEQAYELASYAQELWVKVYGEENLYFLRTVGMALLGQGKAKEAEAILTRRRRQEQAESDGTFSLAGLFADEAYPFLAQGDVAATRRCLRQGLENAQRLGSFRFAVQALPAAALLLAGQKRLEEAAFVYGLIQRYPYLTNSRWYATVALDRLAELLAPLPSDVRAGAEKQGASLDLPKMTEWLLAKLEAPA